MNSQKHLLVIRLSAMGDVAMCIPVLLALTKQNPNIQITVLTRSFFKPLFSQLPKIKVYAADVTGKHKGLLGLWKLYKELKTMKIDAVADLHDVLRSNILKQYFRLGRYTFAQIDKGRVEKKALTSATNVAFKPLKSTHQRYADVFESLGLSVNLKDVSVLPKRLLSRRSTQLLNSDKKYVVGIAPFAAFQGKTYPLDLMENVIEQLSNLDCYSILLFGGGKKEHNQLEIWEANFSNTVNTIEKITFSEELDLISNLDLMIAMDSGNAHLAAAFQVPVITLWGVTHPYAGFYPFGQDIDNALLADREKFPQIPTSIYGNKMPDGYSEAMRTIKPKAVVEKVQKILENKQL